MALNYSGNQYEKAFYPTKLCNWEVPKHVSSVIPKSRTGVTKIIANDRGHLLPSIRKLSKNPWMGLYKGTYDVPKQNNQTEYKMVNSQEILSPWEKRSSHIPVIPTFQTTSLSKQNENRLSSADKENQLINNNQEALQNNDQIQESNRSQTSVESSTKSAHILHDIKNYEQATDSNQKSEFDAKYTSCINSPLLSNVYSNELVAKNLKFNNQKHHMLADAIDNSSYVSLQYQRVSNPGLSLDIEPSTTAIGCKIFQSPGPTQCSKLKIFRPKTAADTERINHSETKDDRPKTTSRIQKSTKPLSGMDLAIYWDISASPKQNQILSACSSTSQSNKELNKDEFSVIDRNQNISKNQQNKLSCRDQNLNLITQEINQSRNLSAITNAHLNDDNRNIVSMELQQNITNKNVSNDEDKEKIKQKWKRESQLIKRDVIQKQQLNKQFIAEINEFQSKSELNHNKNNKINLTARERQYKSTPNLIDIGIQVNSANIKTKFKSRPCLACDTKSNEINKLDQNTDKYKLAFKAGKLNNFPIDENIIQRLKKARNLRVPKPKAPFAKKSYSIGTLIPPFSVWPRVTGYDYPDHWRLVSVYQHSFKPLETRKMPLIKTVFQ